MTDLLNYSHLVFPKTPLRIGITGGIGSGKSYVCAKIAQRGYPVFYCDDEAVGLQCFIYPLPYTPLRRQLMSASSVSSSALCKPVLAAYICSSKQHAAEVDSIVHPCVAERFLHWCEAQTAPVVFMECALLYESHFNALVNLSALVVVDEETRLKRIMMRDHVTAEKARAWIALQMPESEKAQLSDFLLHNADDETLEADINCLLRGV